MPLRPTVRGVVVGALAIGLLVAAITTGRSALFVFVLALGLPLAAAPILVLERGRRAGGARVQMLLAPPLVPVGAPCELSVHLTNTADAVLPPVGLDRPSNHWRTLPVGALRAHAAGSRPPLLAVDAGRLMRWDRLAAGRSASTVQALPTGRRGVFTIGPLRLWVHDPFGLLAATVATAAPVTVVVHPQPAGSASQPAARRGGGGPAHTGELLLATFSDDPAGEWNGLRPYEPGDRLHRLSWQAEARLGVLLVNDFRPETGDVVTIALDDRAGVHRRQAFEEALSVLCGLVSHAAPHSPGIEIVTLTGRRVTGSPTPDGMVDLLTFLARSQPRRDTVHRASWNFTPASTSVVVTTRTAVTTLPRLSGDPSVVVVE